MRRQHRGVRGVVAATAQGEDGFIQTTSQGMGLGWRHRCCEKPSGEAVVHELTTETDLESNENADEEIGKGKQVEAAPKSNDEKNMNLRCFLCLDAAHWQQYLVVTLDHHEKSHKKT